MGTWVDTIYPAAAAQSQALDATELDQIINQFALDYYAWADGELGRLNTALSAGDTFIASRGMTELLTYAQELTADSNGYFDPGVGAMVEAWGFHSADATPALPPGEVLNRWQQNRPSITELQIAEREISAPAGALQIDLGGIAKGEIVDRILQRLTAAGIDNALVNAGGDRKWSIGIQAPRTVELLGRIELNSGEAAFTSGDYERFFESGDERQHHLLNPSSGLPATHTQAVTVIAATGALADAAATAIFVAGPANWRKIALALGIHFVLRIDASGAVEMTAAMRERVRMQAAMETATMQIDSRRSRP
jgi:thiamine biosynthesis lipoprotein